MSTTTPEPRVRRRLNWPALILGAVLLATVGGAVTDHVQAGDQQARQARQLHALQATADRLDSRLTAAVSDRDRWQGCTSDFQQVADDEKQVMSTMADALESMRQAAIEGTVGEYTAADDDIQAATSTIRDATGQVESINAGWPTGCDDTGAGS